MRHQPSSSRQEDRAIGALLGLAVGDAVGTAMEFTARDAQPPLTDMVGGGPFNLQPGEWTDDTAMALALALADSLSGKGMPMKPTFLPALPTGTETVPPPAPATALTSA